LKLSNIGDIQEEDEYVNDSIIEKIKASPELLKLPYIDKVKTTPSITEISTNNTFKKES